MVTSVIELADKLYAEYRDRPDYRGGDICYVLARVCSNANDIGLPLSVVEQLLKDTNYEQLLS